MQHRGITVPEQIPSSALVRIPRTIVWRLVRPYLDSMLRQLSEQNAALVSDLAATNHRISWLEEQLEKASGGAR